MLSDFERDSMRIIDANFNRAKEGFRVCEEICRFHLNLKSYAKALNKMRHSLTETIKGASIDQDSLIKARNSKNDVGNKFSYGPKRKSFKAIFTANAQRVKEALRVLEEFLKPFDRSSPKKIQKLRFDFYTFEKNAALRFKALPDIG